MIWNIKNKTIADKLMYISKEIEINRNSPILR